jgi:hypothetical protein
LTTNVRNRKKECQFVALGEATINEVEGDLLFDLTKLQYDYFCYVSNMGLSPMASRKCYGQRATSENLIE